MAGPAFDETMFRRLAEVSPDAMVAHANGRILWANDAAATQVGAANGQALIGRETLDFVAPESHQLVLAQRERHLRVPGGAVALTEETFLRVDGTKYVVEVAASPLGDGVVLVVARDITKRHQAERDRTSAEARARAFFETTTEAMGISRLGVHVQVNRAYTAMFGYDSPDELIGRSILDLIDPSEHERVKALMAARAAGAPVPSSYSLVGRRRDGSPFLIDVQAGAFFERDGFTTVVVMRDVTSQRASEQRLAESERRYRELFDQVPVGVWAEDLSGAKVLVDRLRERGVTDFRSHFRDHPEAAAACSNAARMLSVNATACRLYGARDAGELIASGARVAPESAAEFASEFADFAGGKREAIAEGWNLTLDGSRRWIAMRAALAEGHEHDWSRVVVTVTDLTERRQARAERDALQDQLRHAERLEAIGRLAGGVAHDFNNLLAAIMANTELALLETRVGSVHESLKTIEEASLRARDLVRQILTFGKKDQPRPEPLDIANVVTAALGLVRAAVPTTVTLNARVHPSGRVLGDGTQVHQIVLNLCANARDAVGGQGSIDLELDQLIAGAEVPELKGRMCARLRVRDDGVGMDEATRARQFEPYMTTRANDGGHGLGLAVVHGIVTAWGGAIFVRSTPARGSTFEVYFPSCEAEAGPGVARATSLGGHERVLLVDDEPLVLAAHARMLTALGYQVTVAGDGAQALAMVRASGEPFDLVISDYAMPRLSGYQLAQALHAERPSLRVLLCTGFSDDLDEEKAKRVGLRGVLLKPIGREALDAAIRAALG